MLRDQWMAQRKRMAGCLAKGRSFKGAEGFEENESFENSHGDGEVFLSLPVPKLCGT